MSKCLNLKSILILTGKESGKQQDEMLEELKKSLQKRKIHLKVEYSTTLHDREIRFQNNVV